MHLQFACKVLYVSSVPYTRWHSMPNPSCWLTLEVDHIWTSRKIPLVMLKVWKNYKCASSIWYDIQSVDHAVIANFIQLNKKFPTDEEYEITADTIQFSSTKKTPVKTFNKLATKNMWNVNVTLRGKNFNIDLPPIMYFSVSIAASKSWTIP